MFLTARRRNLLLVAVSILLVALASVVFSLGENRERAQEDHERTAKERSRACTRAGKTYSQGALVRTPEGVLKCENGSWRKIGE